MDDFERGKTLDDSSVDYSATSFRETRVSARGHRERWSPYARKRKLFPKKSFSLESIPMTHARLPRIELTQSTKDRMSESSVDLESSTTGEDPDDCFASADSSQVMTGSFLASTDSETTVDSGNYCNTIATRRSSLDCHLSATKEICKSLEPGETGQPVAEWRIWCAYAKLMKLAWIKTRQLLNEETHRAENCDLQARSTMTQVISMKAQLNSDISAMRDTVQKIHSVRVILESAQEERSRMQRANETMKSKINCLIDEKNSLTDAMSSCNATIEDNRAKAESLKTKLKICSEELDELKQEKVVLDSEIQELLSLSEQAKDNVAVERKNMYNREVEAVAVQRELKVFKEKIKIDARMFKTVREQTLEIRQEIDIATEGGKKLQEELEETREKVRSRDLLIAELRAKIESAAEQIAELRKVGDKKKSFWRRFQFLPKDGRSLFSIKL